MTRPEKIEVRPLEAIPDRREGAPGCRGSIEMFEAAGFRPAPTKSGYFAPMWMELSRR